MAIETLSLVMAAAADSDVGRGRCTVGLTQFAPLLCGFSCCHALAKDSRDQFVIRGATSCEANIAVTTLCLAND